MKIWHETQFVPVFGIAPASRYLTPALQEVPLSFSDPRIRSIIVIKRMTRPIDRTWTTESFLRHNAYLELEDGWRVRLQSVGVTSSIMPSGGAVYLAQHSDSAITIFLVVSSPSYPGYVRDFHVVDSFVMAAIMILNYNSADKVLVEVESNALDHRLMPLCAKFDRLF